MTIKVPLMNSFAGKVISFYSKLDFQGRLPEGVSVLNPFRGNNEIINVVSAFYLKYYSDSRPRHLILGINPGRFGAGVTGIPFTDTVRLEENCGLRIYGFKTRETSSVFIYEMIDSYGGPEKFYRDFFISAVCPLGFIKKGPSGKEVNYNYYDSKELASAVKSFAVESIKKQLEFGIYRDVCFCLGTGKNFRFLSELNDEYHFFEHIKPLEHPRFIMQYRLKSKEHYIREYISKLTNRAFPV